MNTKLLKSLAAFVMVGVPASVATALAQDTNADTTAIAQAASVAVAAPVVPSPQLPYGAGQILQLAQAKVSDDTIVAYIRNSGNSYNLNADQIIYLQQQGLSSTVINTMLAQPKPGVAGYAAPATTAPATTDNTPPPDYSQQQPASTVTVGPAVTAIDPTAAAVASTYYYQPYYYPAYGYPYYPYGWYPGVSVSLGWGRGWGGRGWHGGGGFHGGWHR